MPLLDAHVRCDETGASGPIWSRGLISALTADPARAPSRGRVTGIAGRLLAPRIGQLTVTTPAGGRRARRSSSWVLNSDSWQIFFHQATPVPEC